MTASPMPHGEASEAERRFGLRPGTYPFKSRFVEIAGARLHYIDEGSGPIVLMVHGNPAWSYLYRRLVSALSPEYRCIAVDLAGFGLSEAPASFSFKPDEQARLVAGFIEALDIRDATLVGHDWGGPVGIGAMALTGDRITRLCLGNTWAWPVNGDFHFEWFSKLLGGPLGRFLARRFAVFAKVIMPSSMRRRELSAEERAAYLAPFADRSRRVPMHVFPAAITGSGAWLATLEGALRSFKGPVHFIWPTGDIAFRDKELAHWRSIFPNATVDRIETCGHFLWEDAPEDCLVSLQVFLARTGRRAMAEAAG
ncbi:MAG: alpha/beta fold hydrolase [Hyphomicrobiales bacterium]